MRRIVACLVVVMLCWVAAGAQNQAYNDYIKKYQSLAIDQMLRYKVPASITLAQGLLESSAGRSTLARKAHNHFGIKCSGGWRGPYYVMDDDYKNEHFRVYKSVKESYEDHSKFLVQNARYKSLFSLKITDYKGWARGLKAAGYATNPNYATNLIQIIEDYELYRFDRYKGKHAQRIAGAATELVVTHEVWAYNDNFYTIAQAGDTYKSIGKEMKVSERRLRRYNEVDKRYELQAGDIVYFEKKQSKAERKYRKQYHTIQPGESLWSISQRYGMRLKTLYKLNGLSADYVPSAGDRLRLR